MLHKSFLTGEAYVPRPPLIIAYVYRLPCISIDAVMFKLLGATIVLIHETIKIKNSYICEIGMYYIQNTGMV